MHRFVLPPDSLDADPILLSPEESHHARNVLRVKVGESVEVLDGRGVKYSAVVAGFLKGRVSLEIDRRAEVEPESVRVTLATGVIRPERMEWMLEKACELGAAEWLPVLSDRGIVKLSRERWQAKLERWKKIAEASCKQCGQPRLPKLSAPVPFKELLERIGRQELALIATLETPARELHELLAENRSVKEVLYLIGPEGDFTPQEVSAAVKKGAKPVRFGRRVLRAETAAIYALSATTYFYGSLGAARIKRI